MTSEPNRVGDYEILNSLGAGGMGQVYRVRNVISDRIEAMKILLPSLSEHPDVAERFLREIKMVGSLHHPNIANLCTAMTINNQLIMVMEYVDGHSFSDLLSQGPLPTRNALNYFDQALAALGYAHGKGIVHRDLKPSNIMLTQDGVVKLMDFGIARSAADRALTQTGGTIGTVSYMSPEQIAGKVTDGRSDLYSMGIFFYETITGVQPFKGDSDYELMVAHMQQVPRRPVELVAGVPGALNEIIMKLLAKTPEERFQNAEEVRAALRAVDGYDGAAAALQHPVPPAGAAKSATRQPTVVESFATPRQVPVMGGYAQPQPPMGMAPSPTGMMAQAPYSGRQMTEVAAVPAYGPPVYGQPVPNALVVQKKGFARHPALYVGGGLLFTASAIAVPLVYTRHHSDAKPSPAAPLAGQPGSNAGAPPADTPNNGGGTVPLSGNASGTALPPNPARNGGAVLPPNPGVTRTGTQPSPGYQLRPNLQGQVQVGNTYAAGHDGPAPQPQQPPPQQNPTVSADLKAELEQEELHIDQLENRAAAVNNSLGTMQRSMANDGLSMRGDIVTRQSSMNNNLAKAKQALSTNDAQRAGKFASLAESDVAKLESFLGR